MGMKTRPAIGEMVKRGDLLLWKSQAPSGPEIIYQVSRVKKHREGLPTVTATIEQVISGNPGPMPNEEPRAISYWDAGNSGTWHHILDEHNACAECGQGCAPDDYLCEACRGV